MHFQYERPSEVFARIFTTWPDSWIPEPLRERMKEITSGNPPLSEVPPSEHPDREPEKSGGIPERIAEDCRDRHRATHTPTRARGTVVDFCVYGIPGFCFAHHPGLVSLSLE